MMTPKIFIALPAFGQNNSSHTTASLVALTRSLTEREWFGGFGEMSFPALDDLRAMFLTLFFDKIDATHILFIDADMRFEPQLVLDMIEFDKPLVGTLYAKKTLPIEWVGSALQGDQEIDGGFLKVEGVGFGVTLIRRDCVQAIIDDGKTEIETNLDRHTAGKMLKSQGIERMIRAFDTVNLPDRRLSEDFSFCWRYRQSGGEVWAATHHRVVHIGQYGFAGQYGRLPQGQRPLPGLRQASCGVQDVA